MSSLVKLFIISLLVFVFSCKESNRDRSVQNKDLTPEIKFTPTPRKVLKRSGTNEFTKTFRVRADVSDSTTSRLTSYLVKRLENLFKEEVLITDLFSTREFSQSIQIEIVNDSRANQNPEAYELDITTKQIKITSSSAIGIYYGIHTLLQVFENTKTSNSNLTISKLIIKDSPEYSIRGVIIDSSHWKDFLEQNLLEKISTLKINRVYISGHSIIDSLNDNYPYIEIMDIINITNNVFVIPFDEINTTINEGLYNKENHEGLLLDIRESNLAKLEKELADFSEISWNR